MPCGYTIDRERRLVLSTAHGVVTYAELKIHQHSLGADPTFHPSFNELWDFTQVTGTDITTSHVRDLAAPVYFSRASRRALVVADASPQIYGMLRMWEICLEVETGREQTAMFTDVSSAMRWIESGWATP